MEWILSHSHRGTTTVKILDDVTSGPAIFSAQAAAVWIDRFWNLPAAIGGQQAPPSTVAKSFRVGSDAET